jgi:hypothetical protein
MSPTPPCRDVDKTMASHKFKTALQELALTLLGKPLSMGPLSVEHYVSVLHR